MKPSDSAGNLRSGMRSEQAAPAGAQHHDAGTAAMAAELGAHTAHLEELVRQGRDKDELLLEDTITFAFPTIGLSVFQWTPAVPPTGPVEIEAWTSGPGGCVFFVLDGEVSQLAIQSLIPSNIQGFVPILFAIGGRGRIHRRNYSGTLSLSQLGSPTGTTFVTMRCRALEYNPAPGPPINTRSAPHDQLVDPVVSGLWHEAH